LKTNLVAHHCYANPVIGSKHGERRIDREDGRYRRPFNSNPLLPVRCRKTYYIMTTGITGIYSQMIEHILAVLRILLGYYIKEHDKAAQKTYKQFPHFLTIIPMWIIEH
jgi:hypothetical protein